MSVKTCKVEVTQFISFAYCFCYRNLFWYLYRFLNYLCWLLWTLWQPVKRQTSLASRKTKQDVVKPYLVSSSSSTKVSRSPFVSQKTSRRVASSAEDIKNAHKEATKISSSSCQASKWTGNFILMVELRRKIITFRSIIDLPSLSCYLSITNVR